MFLVPSDVKRDLNETADVCVIGSGAGGGVFACEMAEAGRSVIVLEEGPYYTKADFDQRSDDMLARLYGERGWAATEDLSVNLLYAQCVGGSTVCYWGDSFRAPADRLEVWTREFHLQGKSEEELRPHYESLEKALHVQPAPPELFNNNNWLIKKGAEALGWRGEPVTQARQGCVGCGFAMEGCAYDAKQSMLVTYLPRASARGAKIFSSCRAELLEVENGRAVGVLARLLDPQTKAPGFRVRVRAKIIALAGGGVGSAVFLLRNGVANHNRQVGKNFHTNPGAMAWALFDSDVLMYRKIPAAYGIQQFRRVRSNARGEYVEGGYLLLPNQLQPAVAAAALPGFGQIHRRYMQNFARVGGTYAILDDENTGQIVLDGAGEPLFRYSVRGRDKLKTKDFLKKSALVLLAAGAKEVLIPSAPPLVLHDAREIARIDALSLEPGTLVFGGPHLLATCRRGEHQGRCVTNSYGESHEIKNLFVVDGSSLPGSVSVDPSLTIMAFARQTAQHINQHWPQTPKHRPAF